MQGRIDLPSRIEGLDDPNGLKIAVQLHRGLLLAEAPWGRLYSYTTYIFVMWMVGSSVVLLAIAT